MCIGLLVLSGLAALLTNANPRLSRTIGAGGVVVSSLIGLPAAIRALLAGNSLSLALPWSIPFGSFYLGVDPLTAFFLIPVLGLSALAAIYGAEYLKHEGERKGQGAHWFFFNLLVAAMAAVTMARNGVLFLMAWEVMSLASFFLVTHEDEEAEVRRAGWIYLIAAHIGVVFLFALFAGLGTFCGSLDFDAFLASGKAAPFAEAAFLLALVGFGSKAGFLPFHVWLPEAHPAAPSHVSAVMSGVMIKMGIYGLLRTLTFLGLPPMHWGVILLVVGGVSGVMGVLYALAQHDLKRLLAYHSVENIGIIALGIGFGLLGTASGLPIVAGLGYAGALLHVLNHALFKGLLFLGAGAVLKATGLRQIDRLGGLLKRMPWTGTTFLVGSAAISALPPFNGFVSEFLIYVAGFQGLLATGFTKAVLMAFGIVSLALIGGLAAACFAKAFGIVFLGEPRCAEAQAARECGWAMRIPMVLLAIGCALAGLGGPWLVRAALPAAAQAGSIPLGDASSAILSFLFPPLTLVTGFAGLFIVLASLLVLLRRWLLSGREVGQSGTWDCGYAAPTPRMQYTASSFAEPLTTLFAMVLRTVFHKHAPSGIFPRSAALHSETPDLFLRSVYSPLFRWGGWGLSHLRWLQHGRLQVYVLYIAVTLLILLLWKLV